jgi:hypothetical protein
VHQPKWAYEMAHHPEARPADASVKNLKQTATTDAAVT